MNGIFVAVGGTGINATGYIWRSTDGLARHTASPVARTRVQAGAATRTG